MRTPNVTIIIYQKHTQTHATAHRVRVRESEATQLAENKCAIILLDLLMSYDLYGIPITDEHACRMWRFPNELA